MKKVVLVVVFALAVAAGAVRNLHNPAAPNVPIPVCEPGTHDGCGIK